MPLDGTLNRRRRRETYQNGPLSIFAAICEKNGDGRGVQAASRTARKPRRAPGEEPGSHRRRAKTLLASEPLAPPADVDLRALSAAPPQPDGFPAGTCDPFGCAPDRDGHTELQPCAISRRHDRQHRQSELSG